MHRSIFRPGVTPEGLEQLLDEAHCSELSRRRAETSHELPQYLRHRHELFLKEAEATGDPMHHFSPHRMGHRRNRHMLRIVADVPTKEIPQLRGLTAEQLLEDGLAYLSHGTNHEDAFRPQHKPRSKQRGRGADKRLTAFTISESKSDVA